MRLQFAITIGIALLFGCGKMTVSSKSDLSQELIDEAVASAQTVGSGSGYRARSADRNGPIHNTIALALSNFFGGKNVNIVKLDSVGYDDVTSLLAVWKLQYVKDPATGKFNLVSKTKVGPMPSNLPKSQNGMALFAGDMRGYSAPSVPEIVGTMLSAVAVTSGGTLSFGLAATYTEVRTGLTISCTLYGGCRSSDIRPKR